ncbi:nascent polypeptide-associated complex protein [Candidatus Borrarchaeum sp.]|uniref:nascent polypeptide-associated complex protein n=1 Tax=Candidatus Borrarchaeum sp. TaxID=2846742 RepID=UPI0025795AAF|nr:nascent polypeptide-associated complex protein [Candidatus Borrarchaeum sp.]
MVKKGKKISPRQMKRMMKQMGLKEIEDVQEVIIRTLEKELVIKEPQVTVMTQAGQKLWQVVGQSAEERPLSGEVEDEAVAVIPEEDVHLVAQQSGVDVETARAALVDAGGDLAKAILALKTQSL